MEEESLYKKLALVAKYKIQPEDVTVLINDEPIINTLKAGDKEAFLLADFVMEKNHEQPIKNAEHVIYWRLKDKENSVKIMGIAWFRGQKIILFKADILDP